jgi:hypothetical protein
MVIRPVETITKAFNCYSLMLVYTHSITPRIQYIFNLIFKEMMGVDLRLTDNATEFSESKLPKLAYTHERPPGEIFIQADTLLFQNAIKRFPIEVFSYRDLPAFFQGEGLLPFDIFAASFYLVTRYEEYLPASKDEYGRFKAKHSLAYKHHFLDKPVINYWVEELKQSLQISYPCLKFRQQVFSATMSFDIDVAYAYKGRSAVRTMLSASKEIVTFNFSSFLNRISVLTAKQNDPYDSYGYIINSLRGQPVKHIFFFLLAKTLTKYDRNVLPTSKELQQLVKELDAFSTAGLHPSYFSSERKTLLKEEKGLLEGMLNRPVVISRQHYLRWQLPASFLHLAEQGILHDYSMGYAEIPGFRAGICTPFPFYNLLTNEATRLTIHPITYMEGSLIEDMGMQPETSITVIEKLIQRVKAVNGDFLCIWHNHTLSDYGVYKGWRKPFEATLRLVKETE